MKRYDSINGLRTIACLGILLMHVKANINYTVGGSVFNTIINEFTNFVFLFMVLSAFSMCCGYFEKIKKNEISMESFYKRRFLKVLPFFVLLLIIDVIYEHNINALIEAFTDLTLMFGFLQKDIQVLGVAWFLGLVFIFYMMFPAFVALFSNKKRAWFISFIALLMNWISIYYFQVGRTNMFYSFIYFCVGGLLYLYKEQIIKIFSKKRVVSILLIIISILTYYILPTNEYIFIFKELFLCIMLIVYAISFESKILNNKVTKFIGGGGTSLEIYLCHMLIFRIAEKLQLTHIVNNEYLSYLIINLIVLVGAMLFSKLFQIIYNKVYSKIIKPKVKEQNQ